MNYQNKKLKESVYLGFNGSIDSSLAALLLTKQKYDVTAVYFSVDLNRLKYLPASLLRYFLYDKSDVEKKAKDLNLGFKNIDLTEEFISMIVDPFLGTKIDVTFYNQEQVLGRFIIEHLVALFEEHKVSCGFYIKSHTIEGRTEVLTHTDFSLDQSSILSSCSKDKILKLLFPLGDLGLKEKNNLIASYRVEALKTLDFEEQESLESSFSEDLVKEITSGEESILNVDFQFDQDMSMFYDEEKSLVRSVDCQLFDLEALDLLVLNRSKPLRVYFKLSRSSKLETGFLYFKSLNRASLKIEESLSLYQGELLSFYDSNLNNSKFIGSAKVSSFHFEEEDEADISDTNLL